MNELNATQIPIREHKTYYVYRQYGIDFQLMLGYDVLGRDGKSERIKNPTLLECAVLADERCELGNEWANQYLAGEHEFFWVRDFCIDLDEPNYSEHKNYCTDYQVIPSVKTCDVHGCEKPAIGEREPQPPNPVDSADTAEAPSYPTVDALPVLGRATPIGYPAGSLELRGNLTRGAFEVRAGVPYLVLELELPNALDEWVREMIGTKQDGRK